MHRQLIYGLFCSLALSACGGGEAPAPEAPKAPAAPEKPALKTDKGVDATAKKIKIGTLNDESGPAAVIGKPYAQGKRILAQAVNGGDLKILPDGWTVELVERDHGYNPQKSLQAFKEIEDQVLFFATSFGTPNTIPLFPMLESKNVVAYPASLSSTMANNKSTPPLGPSYVLEAKRGMEWIVSENTDKAAIKAAVVYQNDDYGKDGLAGWKAAAEAHGVTIVSEQAVSPGQKDFTAVVSALKEAGASHVLLTVLPSATGPILGTSAKLKFMPQWLGSTPAWIDAFYKALPAAVCTNYYQLSGTPFWGEDLPGMKEFEASVAKYAPDQSPDFYVLVSYIQGLSELEVASNAISNGDISRAGYMKALSSVDGWNAGGLIQPISLKSFPYETGKSVRVLKPDFENRSWTVVSDYAEVK
jgi:ABC-type branched-subunit amino acid transport system substrate-binding protein